MFGSSSFLWKSAGSRCVPVNYRNVSVSYVTGNTVTKSDFVYNVTFWDFTGSVNLTAFPAALAAALPSTNVSAVGTIAYGMYFTQGGGLSLLSQVLLGWGSFAPPPAPPGGYPSPPPMTIFLSNGRMGPVTANIVDTNTNWREMLQHWRERGIQFELAAPGVRSLVRAFLSNPDLLDISLEP